MKQTQSPPSIDMFPKDVVEWIHSTIAEAILRAKRNGTYRPIETPVTEPEVAALK